MGERKNLNVTEKDEIIKEPFTLDALIGNIHDAEAPDLPGYMEKEQQERIEARVMAGILELQEKEKLLEKEAELKKIEQNREKKKADKQNWKKKNSKRFVVFGLAAILLMGLCLGVFASSHPDWDVEILQFMGLDETETFQLESGEVQIQVYDSCEAVEYKKGPDGETISSEREVKIMAVSSIGDRNSACIRIETDYELPEDFDETTDYIMPGKYDLDIYEKPGEFVETSMAATTGYVNMDGKLGYMIYVEGCEKLNKSQVKVRFEDFYLYHDLAMEEGGAEKELLLQGNWELTWRYAYKSNTKRYRMLKPIEMDGEKYYITQIDVSPLSVQIEGFRKPWERKYDNTEFTIDRIQYKDGTSLEVGGWSSAGNRDGIWIDTFLGTTEMGVTIDVEQIESIVIAENEISLE